MGRLVKYMGYADIARLEKGEDLGGQMANPLTVDLEFNAKNKWVVEMPEKVPNIFIDTLLEHDGDRFKEVTGEERIPLNLHQTTFMAMKQSIPVAELKDPPKKDEPAEVELHQAPAGSTSEATDTGAATSTVGGSTRSGGRAAK